MPQCAPPLLRATILMLALITAAGASAAKSQTDIAAELSYRAGGRDATGRFMGGTELRALAGYKGKLYAGNGYWEDRPGPEGEQGAQILVLDSPHGAWRVETVFDERLGNGRARDFAISALAAVTFTTDARGARLPAAVSMLIASSWDRTGATRIFSRDDASGRWTATLLARDRPAPDFLPQIRSLALHLDRSTGVDRVFAGQDPRGIFAGVYDPREPGRIRWDEKPELDIAGLPATSFPGLAGRVRVSSFAECNGILYAAIGQQIFARDDGAAPRWHVVFTNPRPEFSETGLRGLTAIVDPAGAGEMLLAAVEGRGARILRIDPLRGTGTTDLELAKFLGDQWKMPATYVIAGYNDMAKLHVPMAGDVLLIGLESFVPKQAAVPAGHRTVDVGYGRLEAGGWYLLRHPDGHYDLRRILADGDLVATRAILPSPFPGDADALYFAGYDANKAPAHNTAWIFRAGVSEALGGSR